MTDSMGHFTAIGMRRHIEDPKALIVNTCSGNDSALMGDLQHWCWTNPTNRVLVHKYEDIEAVSVEALWQGTKIFQADGKPDPTTLGGQWKRGKAKRPVGAYAGPGAPLIKTPGEARRRIYIPAYERLIMFWIETSDEVQRIVKAARDHEGPVYLRDHDTGRGVNQRGPMSHAWVLATFLNTGFFPQE